jgi:hypothetical protein
MEGGTVFHFVTDGIQADLRRATEAANGRDVRRSARSFSAQASISFAAWICPRLVISALST